MFVLSLCAAWALALPVDPGDERNLLFIYVDDMNADVFLPAVQAPALDALAARGVRFERAYPAATVCTPSRTALLAGQYAHRTEVVANFAHQPPSGVNGVPYLPCRLRDAGYHVTGIGKVFHDGGGECFDEEAEFSDDPWLVKPVVPHVPSSTGLVLSGPVLDGPHGMPGKMADEKRADAAIAALVAAAQRLDATGQPSAVWLGLESAHDPFLYPAALSSMYSPADVPPLPAGETGPWKQQVDTWAWSTHWFFDPASGDTPEERRIVARLAYFRCLTYVDQQIGRVVDALDASGAADRTVVVVVSDHGWSFGEHDHIGKTNGFEEDALGPLLVVAPDHPAAAGLSVDAPVSHVDVYPTLMELLHLPAQDGVDGASLVPLMQDPGAPHPPARYSTDDDQGFNLARHVVMRHPADGHVWKLAAWERDSSFSQVDQLYDLTVDPGEYDNRHGEPGLEGLEAGLRAHLREVGLLGPLARRFSVGTPGVAGVPEIAWVGEPSPGAAGTLHLGGTGAGPAPALLVVGFDAQLPSKKVLSVVPALSFVLVVGPDGADLPFVLPAGPVLEGVPLALLAIHPDPTAAAGLARTRALALYCSS